MDNVIRVGAGKCKVHFPDEVFPTPEGFTGVHDDPCIRVLLFDGMERYGLVHFEFNGIPRPLVAKIKVYFAEYASVDPDHIGIHNVHVLSTPHGWNDRNLKTDEDRRKNDLFEGTILEAAKSAIRAAADSLFPANIGYTTTICGLNTNRNILTDKGVWHGSDENRLYDSTVPVIRFDRLDGTPIAMMYGFNSQASVMDGSVMSDGGKLVTADIAGAASSFIEDEYGDGFAALYITGAGGDAGPVIRAAQPVVGKGGRSRIRDIHEEGFVLVRLFGEHLGQQVVIKADHMETVPFTGFGCITDTYVLDKQLSCGGPGNLYPRFEYTYEDDGQVACDVTFLRMNDITFIGVRPEICAPTVMDIKSRVPDEKLIFATFFDIGPDDAPVYGSDGVKIQKAGKYMADAAKYDEVTYQSMNSVFKKGSAETIAENIVKKLRNI